MHGPQCHHIHPQCSIVSKHKVVTRPKAVIELSSPVVVRVVEVSSPLVFRVVKMLSHLVVMVIQRS